MNTFQTDLPVPDEGQDLDGHRFEGTVGQESVQDFIDDEAQKRLWLRAIIPLLQLRSHDSDPSGRVQLAFDLMHIAACERASRLLRSDLSASEPLPCR